MKLTPKTKIYLAVGILGMLLGALWALIARGPQVIDIVPTLSRPQLEIEKETVELPPPSGEGVGRLDPFLSLLPQAEPDLEKTEPPQPDSYQPPSLDSRPQPPPVEDPREPAPQAKPTLPWKLVGLGFGERKMALVNRGGEVLVLREGDRVDGWVLAEIREQAVVFSRDGERVSITMEEVLVSETES